MFLEIKKKIWTWKCIFQLYGLIKRGDLPKIQRLLGGISDRSIIEEIEQAVSVVLYFKLNLLFQVAQWLVVWA
jgi:hypothetical protein